MTGPRPRGSLSRPANRKRLERDVQREIVAALTAIGCRCFVHHATAKGGKRMSVMGFGKGWPDLQVIDGGETLYAEIKRDASSKPRAEQVEVMARLTLAGARCFVWRTAEEAVKAVMKRRRERFSPGCTIVNCRVDVARKGG